MLEMRKIHAGLLCHREARLASLLASIERTLQTKLAIDALNTVRRVDVLDQSDLVASRATLAGDDGAVGKEVFPYLRTCQQASFPDTCRRRTLNHLAPYLATTCSLLPIQFLYHLHRVAE